jgi:anti-sigma regulatory factor (Ser/Thr protein kinase)
VDEVRMSTTPAAPEPAKMVLAEQTQLEIPSRLEWIEPTVEYLRHKALLCGACEEAQAGRIMLALHEALTNSLVHGNLEVSSKLKDQDNDAFARMLAERSVDPVYSNRSVRISVEFNGERCQWTLTDEGPGFNYEAILNKPEPTAEELWMASGRGIQMMRALLDEVRYEAGGRRVILALNQVSRPEKRQHTRWPLHQRVQVTPIRPDGSVDWQAAYEAVTQNLSQGGISLLQSSLARSDRILLGLDVDGQPMYIPAQVRHCATLNDNVVEIGCRFLIGENQAVPNQPQINLEEAIDDLLERLHGQFVIGDERRAHPRVNYNERIEIRRAQEDQPTVAFARDISHGGVAFISMVPVALESHVLTLPQEGRRMLHVRVQIVRCAAIAEGFYDVAARFQNLVDPA